MIEKLRKLVELRFKKYLDILLLAFVAILIVSLGRNVLRISRVDRTIEEARERVDKLKEENEELKRKADEVQSQVYIEKQLRDELGLAKEGEIVLVLPEDKILRKLAPDYEEDQERLPDPNWKKWLDLFL
jgi:cell division protein FtsB